MLDKAADTALVKQLLLVYFSSEDVVKAAILVLACSLVVSIYVIVSLINR